MEFYQEYFIVIGTRFARRDVSRYGISTYVKKAGAFSL